MTHQETFVEFIGVPGAGKSTLAAALAARLANEFDTDMPDRVDYRRKVLTQGERLRLDLRYAGTALRYRLARLAHDVRRSGIGLWTISDSWQRSRYPLVLQDRAARAPHRFHVLDEWLLHRTIGESIKRYGADTGFSRRFAIPPPMPQRCIYISVDVDHDLALERVLAQDQPFRDFADGKDPRRIEKVLSQWQHQLQALKAEIARRGLPMISVDGSLPIDSNAALLHGWLTRADAAAGSDATNPTHTTPA